MKLRYTLLMIFAAFIAALPAEANIVTADSVKLKQNGDYLSVDMVLHLSRLKVATNRAMLVEPVLRAGADSLALPAVGVYGRRRYYYYVRNGKSMLSGNGEISLKASQMPDTLHYHRIVPFAAWMANAGLLLSCSEWGCCNRVVARHAQALSATVDMAETGGMMFLPELVYVTPAADSVKVRELTGSAFVDFPVNKTEIYPEYHNNSTELGKIRATIDSVRFDTDVTITSVWLKGYASPESPYTHNSHLAQGRTAALKAYVQQLYSFPAGVISTEFEPEDWQGLRSFVEHSNLEHRSEILQLIDSSIDPDAKEASIRSSYPADYRFLLQNCYPQLRHTDYRIAYTVRRFSDVEEIKRIMQERPQKLSLNEFYLVAQCYSPDSPEFAEVFETAVRMYPGDPVANLNAANAAMRRGDNELAARYLAKAGDSPEAVYARGVFKMLEGDTDAARDFLNAARDAGLRQAEDTLQLLEGSQHLYKK